jgi:hypothetical protein
VTARAPALLLPVISCAASRYSLKRLAAGAKRNALLRTVASKCKPVVRRGEAFVGGASDVDGNQPHPLILSQDTSDYHHHHQLHNADSRPPGYPPKLAPAPSPSRSPVTDASHVLSRRGPAFPTIRLHSERPPLDMRAVQPSDGHDPQP